MPNSSISTTYILKPNLQDAFWIGLFWFGAPLFPVHVYSVHWMLLLLPTLVHFSNFPFPHLRIGGLRVQGKGGSNHLQLPRGQETRHKGKWRKELGLSVKAKIEVDSMWRSWWWERSWWWWWWERENGGGFLFQAPPPPASPQERIICLLLSHSSRNILFVKTNIGSKIFLPRDKTGTARPYHIRHLWKLCSEKNVNLE